MKVVPDQVVSGTAVELQAGVTGFTFRGTGFYENSDSTFYVVCADGPQTNPWQVTWPPTQTFHLAGYSTPRSTTIFGSSSQPPVR